MYRLRLAVAIGIVGILGLVAVLAWPRAGDPEDGGGPVTTTTTTVPTTTTAAPTTTTTEPATTTLSEEARRAEVEAILQDLWFGWFDAIYRKDEGALWEVVATSAGHEDGIAAMAQSDLFTSIPELVGVEVQVTQILLDRPDCLVTHHNIDVSAFRGEGAVGESVTVLWPDAEGNWRFATHWQHPNDLWLGDCDDLAREETP
jgi:hypothetical protein